MGNFLNDLSFSVRDEFPFGKEINSEELRKIFEKLLDNRISSEKIECKKYKSFLRQLYSLINVINFFLFKIILPLLI